MPLFMDRHDIPGVTPEQVAEAHRLDLEVEAKHDVHFLTYWFDAEAGAAFCLARAPGPEQLAAVHGESHGLIPNVIIPVAEENILKFLGRIEEPVEGVAVGNPFRAILFTDLQGSTSLLDSLGQAAYMVLLTEHDLIVRRALVATRGREVKHTGDGFMASFDEVGRALDCAIAIEDGFDKRNAQSGPALRVRIGIAAGEPVDRGDDLFGSTVTLASRICDAARGGQVLVSDVVRDIGTEDGYRFADAGAKLLKGFQTPVGLFELERPGLRRGGA
ncbi:MAG TPA: nickel-binding protein [Candidatus Limnocylindrales bacterium]|jgi:class 3 adenylate cyclase